MSIYDAETNADGTTAPPPPPPQPRPVPEAQGSGDPAGLSSRDLLETSDVGGDGGGAVADGTGAPAADVLDPETDGRNRAVGVNRRFVLAALAFAGTVFCLILLVFSGGDGEDDALAQTPPPTSPPGAYIDAQTADYYGDQVDDPAVPAGTADPYGADPYAAGYAADPYVGGGAPPDYATTQAYSAPPSQARPATAGAAGAGRPSGPSETTFDRAVLSPLLVGSASASDARAEPDAWSPPPGMSPEQAEELAFMREVAQIFPTAPPPSPGPGAAAAPPAQGPAPSGLTQAPAAARPAGPSRPGHTSRQAFAERTSRPVEGRSSEYAVAVRPAAGRALTLRAGSVVPAALVTGLNSELPGTVIAQVTRNVYDSQAQRDVLIPAGTRLIGEYDDQIAYGQGRALVAWSRMLFPDGSSIDLPGLPGVDLRGYSGLADEVDRHYGRVFGAAVLLAAVGAGVELASPQRGAFDLGQSPQEVASRQIAIELSRVATEVIKRELDVEPTIRVAPGYRFYVLLARDLTFPGPYRARPDVGRFPRR